MTKEVYYCSTIQCVFVGGICTAVVIRHQITAVITAYTLLATLLFGLNLGSGIVIKLPQESNTDSRFVEGTAYRCSAIALLL
jgi:hypothetical protein